MCFVTALSEIGVGLIGVCKVNKPAKDSLVKKKEFVLKSRKLHPRVFQKFDNQVGFVISPT